MDEADLAGEVIARNFDVALACCTFRVAVGEPGVCDECCEPMPRLVNGRCAPCRDGRRDEFEAARGGW